MKKVMKNNKVAVIGAGSWGTAIASVLGQKGIETHLWGHNPDHISNLIKEKQNSRYLPNYHFPENILPTYNLESAVEDCEIICMVVPSHGFRETFKKVLKHINRDCSIVSAVKGIENDSLMSMTQLMEQEYNQINFDYTVDFAVLSGPSFAREVVDGTPTAVTIGCKNIEKAKELQRAFVTERFRVYASSDVSGLEISAAFKNIIAIATGICDGLGYGMNTRAALITRGLTEISRLGLQMNADPITFSGLSGLGDLVLTCTGDLSRNRTVGLKLGQGKNIETILEEMDMVAEGVKTTKSGYRLAKRHKVEMPILEQVYNILYKDKDCSSAVKDLLARELKEE